MKLAEITLNEIQFYVSRQVDLHPDLYASFLQQLNDMARKDTVSLLPSTILENFHRRLKKTG